MSGATLDQSRSPASQRYAERRPAAELEELVSCVWLLQVADDAPAYEHRTVPNGCVEVASVFGTGVVRIAGPKYGPAVERVQPGHAVVGVRIRPGAAPRVLGAAAAELVERDVDLEALWGATGRVLGERLAGAATPEHAMDVLERAVAMRTRSAKAPDPLVAEAIERLQPWRHTAVTEVTATLFISPRQLRRRFVAAAGYGPKALQRILRFQGFLALSDACKGANAHPPLARLAATAGYADQAHLTRECRELTGLTPRAFLAETRLTCGPSHDHAASFARTRRACSRRTAPSSANGRSGASRRRRQLGEAPSCRRVGDQCGKPSRPRLLPLRAHDPEDRRLPVGTRRRLEELPRLRVGPKPLLLLSVEASRTDPVHVMLGRPVPLLWKPTRSSVAVAWCSSSQARNSSGVAKKRGAMAQSLADIFYASPLEPARGRRADGFKDCVRAR